MKLRAIALILLWCVTGIVLAAGSPIDMLQSASDEMIATLNQHKATIKTNPTVVYRIVDRILVPHFDVESMSRAVLGRNTWGNATPDQRQRFTEAFQALLIRTYSSAFAAYTNETVQFSPIRGGYSEQSRVQVQSKIVRQNGPPIPVSYRLVRVGGDWKIYDFSVEGVSIVESFRSQFASDIAEQGLDHLIQKLEKHNTGR